MKAKANLSPDLSPAVEPRIKGTQEKAERRRAAGGSTPPGALRIKAAAAYLGMSPRWLSVAPIPRVDARLPGAERPVWLWRVCDLDSWLASRVVKPGMPSPFE
jgi:hypothetical protein